MTVEISTNEYMQTNSSADILRFAISSGMLNPDDVAKKMRQATIDAVLEKHTSPIAKHRDGRWRTYVPLTNGRKLIARSTYDSVVEALVDFYNDSWNRMTSLADIFPEWIDYEKFCGAADGTIKYKQSSWKNHIAASDLASKPINEISTGDIETWAYILIDEHEMCRKRFYNVGGTLKGILNFAVKKGLIKSNPYILDASDIIRKCAPYEHQSKRIPVFSQDEEMIFIQTAWDCFNNNHHTVNKLIPLAIMFQFNTGLRLSELCALKHDDVQDNVLFVRRMYKDSNHSVVPYTKNYKQLRKVPLTNDALKLIELAKSKQQEMRVSDENYIFSVTDKPLSYSETKKAYTRYCELSDIPTRSSHSTRKTFITKLVDSGKFTVAEIAKIAGNSEQVIWLHYYHAREDITEKVDDMNQIFEGNTFPAKV